MYVRPKLTFVSFFLCFFFAPSPKYTHQQQTCEDIRALLKFKAMRLHMYFPEGDPTTPDSDHGASLVAADGKPEHGEDCDDGQGAGEEQQDRGGDGRCYSGAQKSCETCSGRPSRLYWPVPEAS